MIKCEVVWASWTQKEYLHLMNGPLWWCWSQNTFFLQWRQIMSLDSVLFCALVWLYKQSTIKGFKIKNLPDWLESGVREVIQGNIAPEGQIESSHPPWSSGLSWQQFQSSEGHGGVSAEFNLHLTWEDEVTFNRLYSTSWRVPPTPPPPAPGISFGTSSAIHTKTTACEAGVGGRTGGDPQTQIIKMVLINPGIPQQ